MAAQPVAVISKTGRTNAPAQVLDLMNSARREAGKHPLRMDGKASRAAHYRAADMAARDYFSHSGWEDALRKFGINGRAAGENIAFGQDSADEVFGDWMDSPAHRQNIMAGDFRSVGIARVEDIWCQIFLGR